MAETQIELIIPVYLNQRIVFDVLAMLQDGMSTVTKIVSSEHAKHSGEQRYGASFGLGQAVASLLRIDVKGDQSKGAEEAVDVQKNRRENSHSCIAISKTPADSQDK